MAALALAGGNVDVAPVPNALIAASRRQRRYVPAPPVVNYARGVPDGADPADFLVGTVGDTIYRTEPLDKFGRRHEIGHVFDNTVLTDANRAYFTKLFGLSGPWSQGTGADEGAAHSPDEWFADYYAADAVNMRLRGPHRTPIQGAYATYGPKRLARFESALARIGRQQHLKPLV